MVILYGPAIHDAVASGDLRKMKAVAAALEALKVEIARLESEQK